MRHAKPLVFALTAAALLSGCTTTYRETLEQKLEGKTPAEKRVILAQECDSEIQKGIKPDDPKNVEHFKKMKQICDEMTKDDSPAPMPKKAATPKAKSKQ